MVSWCRTNRLPRAASLVLPSIRQHLCHLFPTSSFKWASGIHTVPHHHLHACYNSLIFSIRLGLRWKTRGTTSWGNVPSLESSLREDEQQIRTDSEPQILQSPKHLGPVPIHHGMRRPQKRGRKGENLVMTPQTQKAEAGLQSEKKPNRNMQHY